MIPAGARIFSAKTVVRLAGIAFLLCWSGATALAEDVPLTPQVAELIREGDMEDARANTKAALVYFEQADKLSPERVAILLRISKQYMDLVGETNPPGEAAARSSLEYAQRAVDLDPKCAKAHLALAVGYGRMTDFTDNKTKLLYSKYVKDETEKSIALDPTDAYAYHVLGRWNYCVASLNPMLKLMAKYVYGGLPEASMEDAAKYLKKSTELAPQRIIHRFELARTYKAMGKTDLATKEWETILALHAASKEEETAQKTAREELKAIPAYERSAPSTTSGLTASNTQPARKQSPPIGVIAPSQGTPDAASR